MRLLILLLVAVSACAQDDLGDYHRYLDSLPTVMRVHQAEAVAVVGLAYDVDLSEVDIRWAVADPLLDASWVPRLGFTFDEVAWVQVPPAMTDPETSTAFSVTAMAHELAHAAHRKLLGDYDAEHSDAAWWGNGGLEDAARLDLKAAGL